MKTNKDALVNEVYDLLTKGLELSKIDQNFLRAAFEYAWDEYTLGKYKQALVDHADEIYNSQTTGSSKALNIVEDRFKAAYELISA